jgi:hypothetical protein
MPADHVHAFHPAIRSMRATAPDTDGASPPLCRAHPYGQKFFVPAVKRVKGQNRIAADLSRVSQGNSKTSFQQGDIRHSFNRDFSTLAGCAENNTASVSVRHSTAGGEKTGSFVAPQNGDVKVLHLR